MSSANQRPPRAFTCIRCFERKVKCDKLNPCTNCTKAKVECIFRIPNAPRRGKNRPPETDLLARLKRYEQLLKHNGIDLEATVGSGANSAAHTSPHASEGQAHAGPETESAEQPTFLQYQDSQIDEIIGCHDGSRVVQEEEAKHGLARRNSQADSSSDDDAEMYDHPLNDAEFMFGISSWSTSVRDLHPPPDIIYVLWQTYLDNVNPMTMIVHKPSLQVSIEKAIDDMNTLTKGMEALMFAIYIAAIVSMDVEECEIKFGASRNAMIRRYGHATRKALVMARFMSTTDMQVLQALVIYLLVMRKEYDSKTSWVLAGVASRVAQSMNLHRDGALIGLPPFEAEMRRRLWWQISIFDFGSGELAGSGRLRESVFSDTHVPNNVSDGEIYQGMKDPPVSHVKATEMIACLLRCEFSIFWKEKTVEKVVATPGKDETPRNPVSESDARIDELQRRIEDKFLRYCDPAIPIQFMTIIVGRSAIESMRFMAHCRMKGGKPESLSPEEREFCWNSTIKLLESDELAHNTKALRKFTWQTDVFFAWQSLLFILSELQVFTLGDRVDKAWGLLDSLFVHRSYFVTNWRKQLHVAVGNLTIKAYDAREAALRAHTNGVQPKSTPDYIRILRERRDKRLQHTTIAAFPQAQMERSVQSTNDHTIEPDLDKLSMQDSRTASTGSTFYQIPETYQQHSPDTYFHLIPHYKPQGQSPPVLPEQQQQTPLPRLRPTFPVAFPAETLATNIAQTDFGDYTFFSGNVAADLPANLPGDGVSTDGIDGGMMGFNGDPEMAMPGLEDVPMPMEWNQWDYLVQQEFQNGF